MIIGVGTDIIEIERVERACKSSRFVKRIFSGAEMDMLLTKQAQSFAAGFAAKEAFAKALGSGFRGFYPCEVEVLRDDFGAPYINLRGKAKEIALERGVGKVHVSLSHNMSTAVAVIVLEE